MDQVWFVAALWLLLALIAVLAANWLRVSTALSEIVVGTVAQLAIGALAGGEALGAKAPWIAFLAGTGAIVLTFLAGAELDPAVFRAKWKESTAGGLVGFFGPFLGAAMVARFVLAWGWRPSWLAGVALSTTSVAVVYAVMLELGFNRTIYGKAILAACFINDLGTVLALGLIFSPFTRKTLIFVGTSIVLFLILPSITSRFFERYGGRVSELETKYLLFHSRRQFRLDPGVDSGATRFRYAVLYQDDHETGRPASHGSRLRLQRPRWHLLLVDDV